MKLDYKKIIKRLKDIHKQIETYLDDYLDDNDASYISFEVLGVGDNIGAIPWNI